MTTADGTSGGSDGVQQAAIPERAQARLGTMRPGAPGELFTSDLSVNEFLLVREAGFRPVGLVLGCSVYNVGIQVGKFGRSMELDRVTAAMYHARELAMTRMEAEAHQLGADGIVGVRLQLEFRDFGAGVAEFVAVGTAVVADAPPPTGQWRTAAGRPFTSDLSGQDFWTLVQAGYAPLGLVMGTCVYHLARRNPIAAVGTMGQNVEITGYTEALYDARERAMSRMQAEAEALGAEGIVGVRLLSLPHQWGGSTTEFFAIGTAVRPLRDDHVVTAPTLVLPLSDGPVR